MVHVIPWPEPPSSTEVPSLKPLIAPRCHAKPSSGYPSYASIFLTIGRRPRATSSSRWERSGRGSCCAARIVASSNVLRLVDDQLRGEFDGFTKVLANDDQFTAC